MPEITSQSVIEAQADEKEGAFQRSNSIDFESEAHWPVSLTKDQSSQVRAIFDYLSPYLSLSPFLKITLERFELGFLRDSDPRREIAIWSQIIGVHRGYLRQHPESTADGGRDVFKCLMMISTRGARPCSIPVWLWNSVNQFIIRPQTAG